MLVRASRCSDCCQWSCHSSSRVHHDKHIFACLVSACWPALSPVRSQPSSPQAAASLTAAFACACLVLTVLPHVVAAFFTKSAVLSANKDKLIVLMASVTWCKPCKAFQQNYEVRRFPFPSALLPSSILCWLLAPLFAMASMRSKWVTAKSEI